MLKKMSVLLMIMLLVATIAMPVFAEGFDERVGEIMNTAISIAQTIGIAVAVILLIVVAIKYMSAAPSDKAEIKKHIVVYVVGAVLLLCASGVLQLIKLFGDTIFTDEGQINDLKPFENITPQENG